MRNTLIVGGIRVPNSQTPTEAFQAFLHNLMQITADDNQILEATTLGEGYTKWIKEKEVHSPPPPPRVRCTESLADNIMQHAGRLKGKTDQEGGFKYYVCRSKPAAHRAVRDKHSTQIQKYREQNEQATDEEDKTVYYFSGSRFFVNGKVVNEDIIPPTARDMMQLSDQIRTAM